MAGTDQPFFMSKMPEPLRKTLLATAAALAAGGGTVGGYEVWKTSQPPSDAIVLAMKLGSYYESSGRHIGVPYGDHVGKGKPLTVCNGVTGKGVVAGRYYTEADCLKLELPRYKEAEDQAKKAFKHWKGYNVWVQASIIDMVFNVGPSVLDGTTIVRLANQGNLVGACQQMTRWVRGTVNGQSVVLNGLVSRRTTTQELCLDWGISGHFSVPINNTQP